MQWDEIAKNFRPPRSYGCLPCRCCLSARWGCRGAGPRSRCRLRPRGARSSDFCFFGLGESKFSGDGEVSVEFGIEPLDAGEHELGDLDRRKLAFAEEFSDFLDRREGQVGVVHGCHINHKRRYPDSGWVGTGAARCCTIAQLEDSFLVTEIPESCQCSR